MCLLLLLLLFNKIQNKLVNFRIKVLGFEQILESRVVINEFLKAIIAFDEELVQLSPTHVTNYVLMKDKYARYNQHPI